MQVIWLKKSPKKQRRNMLNLNLKRRQPNMTEQQELPGMPEDTPLGAAARSFVAQKQTIAEAKLKLENIEKTILELMNQDEVPHFKVSVGGENYEFDLVDSEQSVRCAKITKTVK